MDQIIPQAGQLAQKMIDKPMEAWMALLPILFVGVLFYTMYQNSKREERYHNTMDTTIKEHGTTIAKSTETLSNINGSLIQIKDSLCDVKNRVNDIEDHIGIKGGPV